MPNDFHGGDPSSRTQFGQSGDAGKSYWREVRYRVVNTTLPETVWSWQASDGEYPDQYGRDRMIQIHANEPNRDPWPDHGYSSWLMLPDGRILLVDYTNYGDEPNRSHIVGVYLDMEDIA